MDIDEEPRFGGAFVFSGEIAALARLVVYSLAAQESSMSWFGRLMAKLKGLPTIVKCALAVAPIVLTCYGLGIDRQTFLRMTGYSVANFEVNCDTSHLLVIADEAIEPKSIQIEVKNNGPDPIKAMRCDISTHISWAADKAEDQEITPKRYEFEFNEILRAGETGRVEILPDVVAYMKSLNPPADKESFWAPCTVACSVKLVGDDYFTSSPKLRTGDGDASSHSVSFGMTWKASDKVQMETLNFGISR